MKQQITTKNKPYKETKNKLSDDVIFEHKKKVVLVVYPARGFSARSGVQQRLLEVCGANVRLAFSIFGVMVVIGFGGERERRMEES
jgi:hypothetical protein